jgi:protein SCO1/2
MHTNAPTRMLISLVAAMAAVAYTQSVCAQLPARSDEVPEALKGVEIVERLGDPVPLDLEFVDETGETVRLGDYFEEGRPVILTLNYYKCPQLCTLTLNGLVDALDRIDWTMGEEFRIVTVSFNPEEGPELAASKKHGYIGLYKRSAATDEEMAQRFGFDRTFDREVIADGWHFLTGEQRNIEKLTSAVGFKYRRDPETGQFAHAAGIMFITPDGHISRYMNDVMFDPKAVRLALIEASQGAIGSPWEKALLFTCYQYDPESGTYGPSAMKLMRLGGAMTVVVVAIGLLLLWLRGSRRGEPHAAPGLDAS